MRLLTRFALSNPVALSILVLLVAGFGVVSSMQLKEELMPNISLPVVAVVTPYPNASPDQVKRDISEPLEKALSGVQEVKNVTSISIANVSEIELEFDVNTDLAAVMQKVQDIVSQFHLPSGALQPKVQKFSFNSQPVVYLTLASGKATNEQLRQVADDLVVPALQGVPGVAAVQTGGALPDVVQIQFDPQKLRRHHLTLEQVLQFLQGSNLNMPLGQATLGRVDQPVELVSAFHSLNQIRKLRIPLPPNPSAGIVSMGKSVGQLASGLNQVANGVGQVGKGLGLVEAQAGLLNGLQKIQGQLFGAQLSLAEEMAKPKRIQNQPKIMQLEGAIGALEASQSKLQKQLDALSSAAGPSSQQAQVVPPTSTQRVQTSGPSEQATSPSGAATLQTAALEDIALVTLHAPENSSINRTNGQSSVFLGVVKTEDANTVSMADAVNQKLKELEPQLPDDIHFVKLLDSSTMITASVNGMLREAILGAAFAILVILLFLKNWKTTLIAVVSIPLSLLMAVILLNQMGITLNIMTLGGMAVATGRVVDDSIVVIENIFRSWRRLGGFGRHFVLLTTAEVGHAITASTITTIAVFLPLGFVSGLIGKIFMPFALTVVCALVSSLLVALTVVPLLASLFIARRPPEGAGPQQMDHSSSGHTLPRAWQRAYQKALDTCLNHKLAVLTVTVVAFVASVLVLPLAGSTFIPESKEKYVSVSITMPVGTPRAKTDALTRQVEAVLESRHGEIAQMNTQVGSDPGQLTSSGAIAGENTASMFVELSPSTNVASFVRQVRLGIAKINGPAVIQVKEMVLGGATGAFGVIITGSNVQDIEQAARQITSALRDVPGLANVQNNLAATRSQVNVVPDPVKDAAYGMTPYQIGNFVKNYLSDTSQGTAIINGETYDVTVSLKTAGPLQSVQDIASLLVDTASGQTVPLSSLADVSTVQTPVSVLHRNGAPFAEVTADFTTTDTGKVTKQAEAKMGALHLSPSVETQLSGDSQQQNQSFTELIEAIAVAVGLVYIAMLISFGEWSAPFAILFSMPVALIGAFFGTVIGKQPVSVSSLIGILMLMGIVVTNAIVLVDRVEQQREMGMTVREALLEAGTTRLRPILMTAIATICALAPLAAGFAEGALISQGLAVVVIGGLITSTVLTLVIVPMVYELLHYRTRRRETT